MIYKVVIPKWDSGLNELLYAQTKKYDPRLKKTRVFNPEKVKNEKFIRECWVRQGLGKVKLKTPIAIHYMIFAKDKRHDRQNLGSCLDKCFCDALQTLKVLTNDGWSDITNLSFDYDIDTVNPRAEITITEL